MKWQACSLNRYHAFSIQHMKKYVRIQWMTTIPSAQQSIYFHFFYNLNQFNCHCLWFHHIDKNQQKWLAFVKFHSKFFAFCSTWMKKEKWDSYNCIPSKWFQFSNCSFFNESAGNQIQHKNDDISIFFAI